MTKRIFLVMVVLATSLSVLFGQTRTVVGVIKSGTDNQPLNLVTVKIKGHSTGVVTNENGKYSISAKPTDVLQFIYVGFKTEERTVGSATEIDITLSAQENDLGDVVVIGYGTQRKSDLTGAITTVSNEAMSRVQTSNPAQALQGIAPGVNVVANSGAPGSSVAVRIRGIATVLGGAEPLFVVDGVPVSDISYLGNNDIASINVLKDASATAIYGARGGNGVILITTKQGKKGNDVITFNASWGSQKINSNMNLLTGQEWYNLQKEINKTRPKPVDLTKADPNISTNWLEQVTRTAPMQTYDLSFSGGTDSYKYSLGIGYLDQAGTIKKTDYKRFNLRTNLEKKVNPLITVGVNANMSNATRNNVLEGSNTVGIINSAIKLEPVVPVRNPDGTWGSSKFIDYPNPLAAIEYTNDKDKIFGLVGNVFGRLDFTKDLHYKLLIGTELRRTESYVFDPTYDVNNSQKNAISKVSRGSYNSDYLLVENTLNYSKVFNNVHSFNALLGYSAEQRTYQTLNASKQGTPNNTADMQYLDAAQISTSATAGGGKIESNIISYIARVNYAYADKYLLTASLRADGSSKFAEGNRYGYFPSFAVGYKLSNEQFFKNWNQSVISDAKVRFGWGRVGNQNIDDYAFQSWLSSNIQYSYLFGQPEVLYQGLVAVNMAFKDIKWEVTESKNIGIDLGLFNNKLTFSADYYNKLTENMLFRVPIMHFFGFESGPMMNVGSAVNSGFEFVANWRDQIGELGYNIGGNLSTINNKMLNIGDGVPLPSASIRNGSAALTKAGYPIGMFWGYKTEGLINTNEQLMEVRKRQPNAGLGDVIFADIAGATDAAGNSIPDGKINDADKTMIGKPLPDFYYGFNVGADYKGVDLSVVFEGTQGNDIFNAMRYFTYDLGEVTNKTKDVLNYWRPDNTNTNMPRLNGNDLNDNKRISDRYVEDGSYLRLKTLQLGYTLPKLFTQKAYIQKVRVYVSGQNLLTITKYSGIDPEIGQINSTNYLSRGVDLGTYPQSRIFTVGVNLIF